MSPETQPQEPASADPQASPQDPMLAPVQPPPETTEAPGKVTHNLPHLENKPEPNKAAVKTQSNNHHVSLAIVATVIIVIVLAALAVYAYHKK